MIHPCWPTLGAAFLTLLGASGKAPVQEGSREARSGWFERVSASLAASEYGFEPAHPADTWSAPNRAQGFRSRLSALGLELFPRETSADGTGAPWKLTLRTRAFGRQGSALELDSPRVSASGNKVELDHGRLLEWFENRAEGLEQGWTIPSAPAGAEPLWIGLALGGELSLRIEADGRSGVLVDGRGEARLRYRGLTVLDATGRELPARLQPSPTGLGIAIDDRGARYPLRVDPLLTSPAWSAEGNQDDANFGMCVASAGDVNGDGYSDVIVGAPYFDNGQSNEGRAFVFHGSSTGPSASASWTAESNAVGARFGACVASAGDVNGDGFGDVIVGAPNLDAPQNDEGRAYVFLGSAAGLAAAPAWTHEPDEQAHYGLTVASAGDVNGDGYGDVIIGAPRYDFVIFQSSPGLAEVFHGSATGLELTPAWSVQPSTDGMVGGHWTPFEATRAAGVACAGDVNGDGYDDVILGSPQEVTAGTGRARVYHGSAAGLSLTAAWSADSSQNLSYFGASVSSAGDVNGDGFADVLVGEPDFSGSRGRAHLFLGSALGLLPGASWIVAQTFSSQRYGAVSTAGDVNGDGYDDVLVGNLLGGLGAYLYLGSASGPSTTPDWNENILAPNGGGRFGCSLSAAGDVDGDGFADVIVGSPYGGTESEGTAYVFRGSADGLEGSASWTSDGAQAGAIFGAALASAGDVDGDGFGDVVVGAPFFDAGETDEGRAFLFRGTSAGLEASPAWTAEGDQADASFGSSVASAGDVDGDGYDDVLVGAESFDADGLDEGRAVLFMGSPSGLAPSAVWTRANGQAGSQLGDAVAGAGDVNRDGFADVLVGAHLFDGTEVDEGRVELFLGASGGLSSTPAWSALGGQAASSFGHALATAGDVDGDGRSDVLIGAARHDDGQSNEGRAEVYLGTPSGLAATPAWSAQSDQAGARLGNAVASAGDVNGDGHADVLVGANLFDGGASDEGAAFLYLGSSGGPAATPAWSVVGGQAQAELGFALASAGDVNGDGYADVIVGAKFFDAGESDEGRVLAYLGSATGLAATPAWSAESDQAEAEFGFALASAGDVNGDGYADVIVGAHQYDASASGDGRAFLYLGNGSRAPKLHPRQARVGGGPLALLGRSDARDAVRLAADFDGELIRLPWMLAGVLTARLQWEIAPLGTGFDGVPDGESAPQSFLGSTLSFDELVSELDPGTTYAWRLRFATNHPLVPVTRWFTLRGTSTSEAKLRTAALAKPALPAGPPTGSATVSVP